MQNTFSEPVVKLKKEHEYLDQVQMLGKVRGFRGRLEGFRGELEGVRDWGVLEIRKC